MVDRTYPACFRLGIASGGGASIQSTWPERSAAVRVLASGIGSSTILSSLGTRALSQYAAFFASSALWRGVQRASLKGPVPAGAFEYSFQLPAFSQAAGLVISGYTMSIGK